MRRLFFGCVLVAASLWTTCVQKPLSIAIKTFFVEKASFYTKAINCLSTRYTLLVFNKAALLVHAFTTQYTGPITTITILNTYSCREI
jgi:hypothetical protein